MTSVFAPATRKPSCSAVTVPPSAASTRPALETDAIRLDLAAQHERLAAVHRRLRILVRAVQAHDAVELAGLVGGEPHADGAVGKRREHLAPVGHVAGLVLGHGHRGVEIEPAAVIGGLVVTVETRSRDRRTADISSGGAARS